MMWSKVVSCHHKRDAEKLQEGSHLSWAEGLVWVWCCTGRGGSAKGGEASVSKGPDASRREGTEGEQEVLPEVG